MSADELADILKPGSPWRVEQGTIVADVAPTPAHCRVQLPDGRVISVLGAAIAGTYVQVMTDGATAFLVPPGRAGITATRTSGQSIGSGSQTTITWTAETVDTHGYLTPTSGTITIPAGMGGLYAIGADVNGSNGTSGRSYLQLMIAGSRSATIRGPWTSAGEDQASIARALPLAAGDTVSVALYHATGSSLSWTGTVDIWRISY